MPRASKRNKAVGGEMPTALREATGLIPLLPVIEMTIRTLDAPIAGAQPQFSDAPHVASDRLQTLSVLPQAWQRGLLAIGKNKEPIGPEGRPLADWPTSPQPSLTRLLAAPAVGLRTGQLTNTVCLDFDGETAWAAFEQTFGGTPEEVLPPTIAWTSGRPHRCQMAFNVPIGGHWLLKGKRRKIDTLEIRWQGAQSVLLGHHPTTDGYRWLPGCSPFEQKLATIPQDILRLIPEVGSRPARQAAPTTHVAGLVVPLEQFVSLRSRMLLDSGSEAGSCNDDGLRLSLDLIGAEQWLKQNGASPQCSARSLFEQYCERCPQTINGKPFDWRAMDARFEGALARSPQPQTPEDRLLERLAFHKRMARKGGVA